MLYILHIIIINNIIFFNVQCVFYTLIVSLIMLIIKIIILMYQDNLVFMFFSLDFILAGEKTQF